MRTNIESGSTYEPKLGCSRAVKMGPHVWIGGTAAIDENGENVGVGDATAQTQRIFEIIAGAMTAAGGDLSNVVRTRIYVTDVAHADAAAEIHGEIFGQVRPACTVLLVPGFFHEDWLVEIEADAYIPE